MGKIKDKELHDELVAKTKAENKVLNNKWRFRYNSLSPEFKTKFNMKVYPASQTELELKVDEVVYTHSETTGAEGIYEVIFEDESSEDASKK